jgi:hypothetical protein
MQQQAVPQLVYELSHSGAHMFPSGFGICIDNQPFDANLPKLFRHALSFIKSVAMLKQPYWILR